MLYHSFDLTHADEAQSNITDMARVGISFERCLRVIHAESGYI